MKNIGSRRKTHLHKIKKQWDIWV